MTNPFDFEEFKTYIEGPEQESQCTVNVPKYVSLTLQSFLTEILQRIKLNTPDITPQNIIDLIKNTPEYSFLLPAVDKIST